MIGTPIGGIHPKPAIETQHPNVITYFPSLWQPENSTVPMIHGYCVTNGMRIAAWEFLSDSSTLVPCTRGCLAACRTNKQSLPCSALQWPADRKVELPLLQPCCRAASGCECGAHECLMYLWVAFALRVPNGSCKATSPSPILLHEL